MFKRQILSSSFSNKRKQHGCGSIETFQHRNTRSRCGIATVTRVLRRTRAIRRLVRILSVSLPAVSHSYRHQPCTRAAQAQFQFPDCYLPPMNGNLLLSDASFLFSHNAATGYIPTHSLSTTTGLSGRYSKNQIGTVYEQLRNGARALDLRPLLLRNGTVLFQHGVVRIFVTLEQIVTEALQWCRENPDELVLLLPSHFAYESLSTATKFRHTNGDDDDVDDHYYYHSDDSATNLDMVSALAAVFQEMGLPYYDCSAVYGLTVAQTLELSLLSGNTSSGHLLVLDGHDVYGTSCSKENWVERQLVTCYPNNTVSCINHQSPLLFQQALRPYLLASANDAATDERSVLGPPLTPYDTPFNEIQALWQVTTTSAVIGVSRLSSIRQDNQRSHINEHVMNMIYSNDFDSISLLAVDYVALNGNAILSVLRNQCGQSLLGELCGDALPKPKLASYSHWTADQWMGMCLTLYATWFVYSVFFLKRPKLLYTAVSRLIVECKAIMETDRNTLGDSVDESRREELL